MHLLAPLGLFPRAIFLAVLVSKMENIVIKLLLINEHGMCILTAMLYSSCLGLGSRQISTALDLTTSPTAQKYKAAVIWLKHCRHGVKHYPIYQSIKFSSPHFERSSNEQITLVKTTNSKIISFA